MNELRIFNYNDAQIRTVEINGELWFVGKDVAEVLGYKNTKDAISRHVDIEDKRGSRFPTPSGEQEFVIINESGLYSLILSSKLSSAKEFKRWVTSEVIPSIRKHGAYMTESTIDMVMKNPEIVYKMAETMLSERERRIAAEKQLDEAKPKADYYDAFVNPEDYLNLRTVAKELKIPEREFVDFLLSEKIFFRSKRGHLLPYNKQSNEGLFVVKDYSNGKYYAPQTLFTPNGKDYIRIKYLDRQKES